MQKLVQAHLEELRAVSDECSAATRVIGRCDRTAAESAVSTLYKYHGMVPPGFVWFDSPPDCFTAIALCHLMNKLGEHKGASSVVNGIMSAVGLRCQTGNQQQSLVGEKFGLGRFAGLKVGTDDYTQSDRDLLSVIRYALADHFFPSRASLETYTGVVVRNAIDWANEALTYSQANKLLQVCATIEDAPNIDEGTRQAWSALRSTIAAYDERTFHAKVTAEQSATRISGCLISRKGYDTDNLVTAQPLVHCAPFALLNTLGVPYPAGFAEARDALTRCGWWYPMDGLCFMIDRPTELHVDANLLMHNESGAAITYGDGWKLFCWHGMTVPESVIRMQYNANDITKQPNVEVRRLMVERYGAENYLKETGVKPIHSDRFGVLYELRQNDDEPLVMVQVINSTPEPDGTFKHYFLRVPPTMRRAKEAVAWTFGLAPEDYCPFAES